MDRDELLPPEGLDARAELEAYRNDLVMEAISRTPSWRAAASLLGLSVRTFQRWAHAAGAGPAGDEVSATDARTAVVLSTELGWSMARIAEYLAISDHAVAAALERPRREAA